MNTSEYSDSKIDTLAEAARVVGSTSLIQKNAGNIINTLRTVLSAYGYDLFPDDESQYNANNFYRTARPQDDEIDIEKELEAKFDELFGDDA